ncbi:tRNA uridine(34) 5-carboxymethylaminomethyl modification radical SAM/GNAT enzyme Elp3, partial [Candidatus Gracilibacteria bacterium]|nr:tRNA uridine(34) 5-carboxymethylaminomethyl modification radical SAM/GNAT enzyme Elp3 [Candidatus Gracilibacteria bacterium]
MSENNLKLEKKFLLELKNFLEDKKKSGKKFVERDFFKLKNKFSEENKISHVKNIDLIQAYRDMKKKGEIEENKDLERIISRRKIRSESGVAVITNMTKPFPCPGKCVYCPTAADMPKSYLPNQPAAMRAVLNKFDPFNQTQNRLASLMVTGHDVSKIEIIVIGGTWSYLPVDYQEEFILQTYNGLNQKVDDNFVSRDGDMFKVPKIKQAEFAKNLEEATKKNETADYRCVGMTLETRPDRISIDEIKRFRRYGCTRVELGVQSLFDDVQEITKRGHTRQDVANAMQLLRDTGYKVSFHLMPGLPGSNTEKDIETVRLTFEDENFKPDLVKFYPCMVIPGTELANDWKAGKYQPLRDEELKPVLMKLIEMVPRWCRITRLIRDIPAESILDGCKTINLRQLIEKEMKEKGIEMNDIRSREIKTDEVKMENIEMRRENFKASGGDEIFLTFDEKISDKLISLLRLRIPSQYFTKEKHFLKELEGCAIIREVHTYGVQTVVGGKSGNSQHFGFGRKLLAEAERIAKEEYGLSKIAVIAGVGVRKYYEKFGYKKVGTYM